MSRKSDTSDRLKKVERFAKLSDKELRKVAERGTLVKLPSGRTLMSETTPADKAYLILSGEVVIRHRGEDVATVGAGDMVGEIGVLEKRLRTAGVVAITDLEVVHFTHEDLTELVDEIPSLAEAMRATAEAHRSGGGTED